MSSQYNNNAEYIILICIYKKSCLPSKLSTKPVKYLGKGYCSRHRGNYFQVVTRGKKQSLVSNLKAATKNYLMLLGGFCKEGLKRIVENNFTLGTREYKNPSNLRGGGQLALQRKSPIMAMCLHSKLKKHTNGHKSRTSLGLALWLLFSHFWLARWDILFWTHFLCPFNDW